MEQPTSAGGAIDGFRKRPARSPNDGSSTLPLSKPSNLLRPPSPVLETAQQLARRLVDRERNAGDGNVTTATAAALAGERLCLTLSRWIGGDGCHALFTRARAQAQAEHRPLDALYLRVRGEPYIEGVAESIKEYGDAPTAVAIEATLVGTIELLGRLIGVEMATNLIEPTSPEFAQTSASPKKRRAQA